MDKNLFSTITKQAHKLTKQYRKRFKCDYMAQYSIFFKMVYMVHKKDNKVETVKTVKAKALYSTYNRFYKEQIKRTCDTVVFYIKGVGAKIQAFMAIVQKDGSEEFINQKGIDFEEFLSYGINIFKWVEYI